MLMQGNRINVELIKKIITEKKTKLLSLRNQDWKKMKTDIEKVNKLLRHILTCNTSERYKLIYARTKLVCDKIGIPPENSNKSTKPG